MPQKLIEKSHIIPPVYKAVEDLTASDIVYLQEHAQSMRMLLKSGKSDIVVNRRHEIREELHRVVEFLFQFNVNLIYLTDNND